MRFTKVLTKYSTEYNNYLFVKNFCFMFGMDQSDLFAFFLSLRDEKTEEEIYEIFENYEINKLDINRMYRYLDKHGAGETVDDEESVTSIE